MALPAEVPETDESLERLRRCEVTLEEYLDERVEAALAHVRGRVSEEKLEILREVVREHTRTDPAFIELVRKVTGRTIDPSAWGTEN